ncbi:MAG: hypothetical protein NTZ84_01180 [Candidatus Nealsonbacteria bacterium]|nr:hypothetical protein [Candidatus Nealsonbacteria bacterium]
MMKSEKTESAGKKKKDIHLISPFDPKDIIIKMSQMREFKEDVWQEFLETKPDKGDLCLAICRAYVVKEKSWEELLKREPAKENLLFLFGHLRDSKLLNYKVWDIFKAREDLERKDFEKVLQSKRIDIITTKEAKVIMRRYPVLAEKEPDNEESGLSQQRNDFFVNRKKRLNKPWERDYRNSMCG